MSPSSLITVEFLTVIFRKRIMDDKFIQIPNDDKQNYTFCLYNHIGWKFNKLPKVFEPTNKTKCSYKTLGTSRIYSPMYHPSLNFWWLIQLEMWYGKERKLYIIYPLKWLVDLKIRGEVNYFRFGLVRLYKLSPCSG